MGKASHEDLRNRVVEAYQQGQARAQIILRFGIGMDSLSRWVRQYRETGDLSSKKSKIARTRK